MGVLIGNGGRKENFPEFIRRGAHLLETPEYVHIDLSYSFVELAYFYDALVYKKIVFDLQDSRYSLNSLKVP